MTRPEIRHKRMRVGDLPPETRRWMDSGDPDEVIDVYEDVSQLREHGLLRDDDNETGNGPLLGRKLGIYDWNSE